MIFGGITVGCGLVGSIGGGLLLDYMTSSISNAFKVSRVPFVLVIYNAQSFDLICLAKNSADYLWRNFIIGHQSSSSFKWHYH